MVSKVVQVLTALVEEQATSLIDNGLSNTLLALVLLSRSYYHDQTWC